VKATSQFDALIDKWNHEPVVRVLRHIDLVRELVPSVSDSVQGAACDVEVLNRPILRDDENVTEAIYQPRGERLRQDICPSGEHCLPIESGLID
jgi:hypothetical protein